MATPCHFIHALLLPLALVIWCPYVESWALKSEKSNHQTGHKSAQPQDSSLSIEKPVRIQPSRPWLFKVVSDSTRARPETTEFETITWDSGRNQIQAHDKETFNVVKDNKYRSPTTEEVSVKDNVNIRIKLIKNILFSGNRPKRRHRTKRNAVNGNPPMVNATWGSLNASYCSLFYFRIPDNTFVDKEDGSTRNLTLSLHYENDTLVDPTSWLQLNVNLQTLYGYLKASDDERSNSDKFFNYKLRARDSSGLTAEVSFSIKIPPKPPEVYFRIDLAVNSFEAQGTPDVNEVLFLAYKIFSFFQDISFSTMNILSFQKNNSKELTQDRIAFGWTNCTISGKDCPADLVNSLINRIIMPDGTPNPTFSASFQPQYTIHDLKARKVGPCQDLSTSLQPAPTPTPVDSLSPMIKTVLPQLSVSTTAYFTYKIPANTFYDSIDGYTRSLSLQLRTADDISLTTSSWLQFATTTQTIYGILTSNLFSSSFTQYFSYVLIATNSRGYSTRMIIKLKGERQQISFGALFLLQGRDNSPSSTNDVTILSTILQNLRKYLKDSDANTIEVKSFKRTVTGQQRIFSLAYFNTTITTANCAGLDQIIPLLKGEGTLIHEGLTVALVPEVVADRMDITRYGSCSLSPSPTPGGLFPSVQHSVPVISIRTGVFFQYRIPANSFYDATDGNSSKLTLQFLELNGTEFSRKSWIQFDALRQNVYGLLPSNQQTVRPFQNFTFLLRARNSFGNTATQVVTIQSQFVNLDIGVVVAFTGRDYSSSQWNSVQLQNFMLVQLRDYLGATSNETIQMLSFQQQATGQSQFSALWTDSRLTSTGCDLTLLLNLESKIFSSKGEIHTNLVSMLLPSVVLLDAKITYYGQCSRNQSTKNSPVYTTAIPLIKIDTGFLFTYTIPRNTFTDNIDGDTRSLRLTLSNIDGSQISPASHVQFNSSAQAIMGIILDDDLIGSSSKAFHYTLIASNSRNFNTSVSVSILATLNANIRGIVVNTSSNVLFSGQLNTVQLSMDFLRGLSNYIQPSTLTDFSIISLKKSPTSVQQVMILWSNNKINPINCKRAEIEQFKALLNNNNGQLNPQFVNAMSPTFNLSASNIQTPFSCIDDLSSITIGREPVSIAPTQSIPLTSSDVSSVVANKNNPPTVTSKILPLFAYFCIPFSYAIPSDLFYDQEQGGTRNLQIHLQNHDRQPVGTTSWMQFSKTSQVLYGILKTDDFYRKPSGGYKYYLVATDNQGLQATTDFTITIPESPLKYNHVINMTLNRVFDISVPDVNEQLIISTKILESYGDANSNNINLISYGYSPKDKTAVFTYSNCSLSYSPCPTNELGKMLSKITDSGGRVTDSFKNSMLPQYTVHSIRTEKLSPCNISEPSMAPTTSIAILPSPSVTTSLSPILQTQLSQLNITWCAPFEYRIPANMFNDPKDGSTRMLSVELFHLSGLPLANDYWLKFDKDTQTLQAYPILNDIEQYEIKKFLVTAKNSRNMTASQVISIAFLISKPSPNHQILITASAYVTKDMSDVDIRILIYNKMKTYFKSNQSEVLSFASYTRTGPSPAHLQFTFSYCSLTENPCDRSGLDSLTSRIFSAPGIINFNFILAFSPEIVVKNVAVQNIGLCSSTVPTPSWIHSSIHEVMSTSVVTAARNQKPLVLQSIGILDVEPCKLFTFTIPERSFYDIEDGFTRDLKVTVTTLAGLPLSNASWIIFNSTTQTFKGVIVGADNPELQYILTATDKGGLSVSQTLKFRVKRSLDPLHVIVNTTVTNHLPAGKPRVEVLEYFINNLVKYLSDSTEVSIQILSFEQRSHGEVNISWTTCNIEEACNATFFSFIRKKLVTQGNIVNPSLELALGPSLLVNHLHIQNVKQCTATSLVTSTALSYTTISVSSLFVSVTEVYASTIAINSPPRFNKDIPALHVSLCSQFSLRLPSDLCVDQEDGFRGTKIAVSYRNGSSLTESSLLQFNNANRTVYGIIKESDLLPNGQLKNQFLIYCEDTKGLRVSRNLTFNVSTFNTVGNKSYSLTFQTYLSSLSSLPDVDIQLLWMQKLSSYLQHPSASAMVFLNFKRVLSIQAEFSIRLCFLDACNYTAVSMVRDKIFSVIPNPNPQFIDAMIPEFNLVSVIIQAPLDVVCPTVSAASSTTLPQTSSIPATYNTPVVALRSLPVINVTICSRFQYVIPFDTFYDKEDGFTSNLTVTLQNENNSAVNSSSWVQYDNSTLSIVGYILHEVAINAEVFQYKLVAQDSRESTASTRVTLKVLSKYNTISHYFTTEGDLYSNLRNNVDIMTEVASKIKSYIGSQLDPGVFFLNFAKHDFKQPKVVFTWGSCALLDSCDKTSLKAISDQLLLSGAIINQHFISALAPDIVVKVAQSRNTNCSGMAISAVSPSVIEGTSIMSNLASTIILPPTSYLPEFSSEAISPTATHATTTSSITPAYPMVRNTLYPVITTVCSILFFQIPENTFYDASDGYTRNLKLTARLQGETSIPETSWLTFDSSTQTFTGQPTIEAVKRQPENGYLHIIRATNKMNLFVETSLIIKINDSYPSINHNITLQFEEIGTSSLSTLDVISIIRNSTALFFGEPTANNIGIIGYSRNRTFSSLTNVTWYNCSIGRSNCDFLSIEHYFSKMVDKDGNLNRDFSSVFLPRLRLTRVKTAISRSCYQVTSPLRTSLYFDAIITRLTVQPSIHSIASTLASSEEGVSKYSLSSVIGLINSPPVSLRSVNISLSFCGSLRFTIPIDTFYDKEDGATDNLDLRLSSMKGIPTDCNSTVRLNRTSRQIYGGIVPSMMRAPMSFLLTAKDRQGLAATSFVRFLATAQQPQFTTFTVTFKIKQQGNKCTADIIDDFHNAMKVHLPFANISLLYYKADENNTLHLITWTDCSFLNEKCDSNSSSIITQSIIRNNVIDKQLSSSMLRVGEIQSVSVFSTKICSSQQRMFINITFCNKIKYILNDSNFNSTVFDIQSDSTELISFQLTSVNGDIVPWAGFNSKTNSIAIMPVYNALKNRSSTQLLLNATYKGNVIKSIGITLFYPSAGLQANYSIKMKIISYKQTTLTDVELLEIIMERLLTFASSWLIIDYNRTKVFPETVHVTLAPCFTIKECNNTRKDLLTSELSLGNGVPSYAVVRAFLPDLVLSELSVTSKGTCDDSVTEKTNSFINITIPLCTELYSPVKDNILTGYVNSSGDKYELLNFNKEDIGLQSWVQFDRMNRVIYGVPTQKDLIDQPGKGYLFFLRISQKSTKVIDVPINITIIGNTAKPVYSQTIFYQSLSQRTQKKADILLEFRAKIAGLLGNDSADSIGVISFDRGFDLSKMSKIEFTNCSLLQLPGSCNNYSTSLLARKTILANGQPSDGIKMTLGINYTIIKIIESRSDTCGNSNNTLPIVNVALPGLNVSICAGLDFQVPNDTFVDKEDGNVQSLVLSLKTGNGSSLNATSWIQFDMYTKTIYGIPTYDVIENKPANGYSFLLEAKDSQNGLAVLPIAINLNENITERSLISVIMNTSFPVWTTKLEIQREFLQKTEMCLNISKKSIAIAYYRQTNMANDQINISIFHNCSNVINPCDETSINHFFGLFVTNLTVNEAYKSCMTPEFSIIQVKVSQSKLCRNLTANSPPMVNRLIPQLNLTFCEILYYKVPNDTFTDIEDGAKILQTAELITMDGRPVQQSEFVQYDKETRMIHALFPQNFNSSTSIFDYKLQVKDTVGEVATAKVSVRPTQTLQNFTYRVCLSLRRYSSAVKSDIDIMINLLERIEFFMTNTKAEGRIIAINYRIDSTYPQTIDFCFSNCSFINSSCDRSSVDAIKRKTFLRDGVPTLEFRQMLNPDFVIIKATDTYSDHCATNVTPTTVLFTSVSPLTSSITSTPTSHCVSGRNSVPIVLNSIGTLTVYVGQPRFYDIKSDVIYDKEDGYLRISALMDMNGNEAQDTWIKYDKYKQRIYVSVIENNSQGEKSFKIVGRDSCGASVYDVLKVKVLGSVSCCYTIKLLLNANYSAVSRNTQLQYSLYERLTQTYNDTAEQLRFYSINSANENYTEISYTNSSFNNESCYYRETRRLSYAAFYENGTARKDFISKLSDFQVVDAMVNNHSRCNVTQVIVPPVFVPPPGNSNALTYQDWLWYMLPFIILAFLVICCCFLFYWCTACRKECCGAKKADDLFAASAAQPIQEEVMPQKGPAVRAEDPSMAAQAAASRPQDELEAPYSDAIYADIGTTKDSSVPSLHKNKQLPVWMRKAENGSSPRDSSSVPAREEPMIAAVAALPQEALPDSRDPLLNVASQPRRLASEAPLTASHTDNVQRRPSYLMSPLSSQEEDPFTQSVAPSTQLGQPVNGRPEVDEDLISPVNRQTMEAEPSFDFDMAPVFSPIPSENNDLSEVAPQTLSDQPNAAPAPALRLPSIPLLPPGEPPPPYPSSELRSGTPKKPRSIINDTQLKQSTLFSNRPSNTKLKHRRGPALTPENYEMLPLSQPRLNTLPRPTEHSLHYPIPREKAIKPTFIRRTFSKPRKHRTDPKHSLHTRREPVIIERRPKSVQRHTSPSISLRKSPSLDSYLTESDTDVTSLEEHSRPEEIRRYERKEYSDPSDDGSQSLSEKQVPVEINGVVNAPESVLMNWMRDGTLKTTITNARPKSGSRKKPKDKVKYVIKSPGYERKREKKKLKGALSPYKRKEHRPKSASKPRWRRKRGYADKPNMYVDDDVSSLSDDVFSYGKASERTLKRGYPYSKDPYEYVETAPKPRQMDPREWFSRKSPAKDVDIENGQMRNQNLSLRNHGRNKPRRNMSEIFKRMSRRKDLKRDREAFENEEFYGL